LKAHNEHLVIYCGLFFNLKLPRVVERRPLADYHVSCRLSLTPSTTTSRPPIGF